MALMFLRVLIVLSFQVSSFTKPNCRDIIPNSPNLNPLDYQVWEQCWSLITSWNRNQQDAQLSQRNRAAGCVI